MTKYDPRLLIAADFLEENGFDFAAKMLRDVSKGRPLILSKNQLIHARRFLYRGLFCATNTSCPSQKIDGRYYVDPIIKKIQEALGKDD